VEGEDLALFERSLRHATGGHTGGALDAALDELGWADALAVDTRVAVSLLFGLQGGANATSSALERVVAHALGHPAPAVVLPALGRAAAPGTRDGKRVVVRGVATTGAGEHDTALVVTRSGEAHVAVAADVAALQRRAVHGIDPSIGVVEVVGEVESGTELGPVDWHAAVAVGQLALGHELVGASRRMLELAREHAVDRVQFGRPIATFQAVSHRLAETLVALEAADAVLDAAWLDRAPPTAAMAKASAGRAARVAARHCQQVLAGIGFTSEHSFHRYAKRVFVLDQLLGSTRILTAELGSDILERRRLPDPIPL
jgi:alkylation response protein AidB-like acyl-CoA dehydrogenase